MGGPTGTQALVHAVCSIILNCLFSVNCKWPRSSFFAVILGGQWVVQEINVVVCRMKSGRFLTGRRRTWTRAIGRPLSRCSISPLYCFWILVVTSFDLAGRGG